MLEAQHCHERVVLLRRWCLCLSTRLSTARAHDSFSHHVTFCQKRIHLATTHADQRKQESATVETAERWQDGQTHQHLEHGFAHEAASEQNNIHSHFGVGCVVENVMKLWM
jgi:hypothetical protein